MNQNKYPVTNYVPHNPDNYLTKSTFEHSLGDTLDRQKYQKIMDNPRYHFANSYVTNFDIIHHECRGDKLENSKKYYETIYKEAVDKEIQENKKTYFISEAIDSEREDVFLKKNVLTEHFNRLELEQKLEQQGIFLSSMKRRAFNKKKKNTLTTVNLCLFNSFNT